MRRSAFGSAIRLLALLVLMSLGACGPRHAVRVAGHDWDERWPALARRGGLRWPVGTTLSITRYDGVAGGTKEHHERWTLLRRDSTLGEFEVRRDEGSTQLTRVALHPSLAPLRIDTPPRSARRVAGGLVAVRVPAGRFDCGHTSCDREASDGRVMRIDEWWAPNIPIPVERWVRWDGGGEVRLAPPHEKRDVATGMSWSVLVAIRQP